MDSGNPFRRPDAIGLQEQPEAKNGLVFLQSQIAQRLGLSFNPRFTAEHAPKPLVAVTIVAVVLYLVVPTGGGYHSEIPFFWGSR